MPAILKFVEGPFDGTEIDQPTSPCPEMVFFNADYDNLHVYTDNGPGTAVSEVTDASQLDDKTREIVEGCIADGSIVPVHVVTSLHYKGTVSRKDLYKLLLAARGD